MGKKLSGWMLTRRRLDGDKDDCQKPDKNYFHLTPKIGSLCPPPSVWTMEMDEVEVVKEVEDEEKKEEGEEEGEEEEEVLVLDNRVDHQNEKITFC